jgi:hypothetical protein
VRFFAGALRLGAGLGGASTGATATGAGAGAAFGVGAATGAEGAAAASGAFSAGGAGWQPPRESAQSAVMHAVRNVAAAMAVLPRQG